MKAYLSFFRIRFSCALQYRAAAFAGVATQFAWGLMEIMMFRAFYRTDASAFPMEFSQLVSYIWLQQAFIMLFFLWFLDNDVMQSIISGNVSYELIRPLDLYNMWFTRNIAVRYARALLRCAPILIVAALLPEPYGMSLPAGLGAFFMFLVTFIMGSICAVALCMLIYIASFYTLNPTGLRVVILSVSDFLSGALIPLPFMPEKVRVALEILPFGSLQNLPLRIYAGDIAGIEMWQNAALQLAWAIILILAGRLWMKKAISRVVVQGG